MITEGGAADKIEARDIVASIHRAARLISGAPTMPAAHIVDKHG